VWLALALPVAAGAVTFVALTSVDRRGVWVTAVGVLALTIADALVDAAPESKGRLRQRLDGLELPFFHQVDEQAAGHSWCRPDCPEVVRRYKVPSASPRANELTIVLAMMQAHLLEADLIPPPLPAQGRPLTFRTDDVIVRIDVAPGTASIELASR
jgi:hypothetical protein